MRSVETKLKTIRARQLAAIAAYRAAKTDADRAYWQQQYDAALDTEDERSRVKSSAWIEDAAQGQLERARNGSSAPRNTPPDTAADQAQNVPLAPTAAPPLTTDDFSGVVAEVVKELETAGVPPSLKRVWRAGDKGKRIKSVSERLPSRKITRFRVEKELRFFADCAVKKWPLRGSLRRPAG